MRVPALALTALLAAALLAGCMSDSKESKGPLDAGSLKDYVLQTKDLAGPWSLFDEGEQARADAPAGARANPTRFGRINGWKARYRRSGSASTPGPLVIESRADAFETEAGAIKDFAAIQDELVNGTLAEWKSHPAPEVGDEALAAELTQGSGAAPTRYVLVAWRQDNVTASLLLNGFAARLKLGQALSLARKQQRHIAPAGGK